MTELPSHAQVVVIGGGAVGCSVLYHLCHMGWRDCVLLEKNELTSGSSWHAAGNCPNFSASWSLLKMQSYSTALYRRLGEEVDYPIDYHITGAVRLAHSRERMMEFERVVAMARHQGIDDFAMMSAGEMRNVYPFLQIHDLQGGCWDPLDGDIDPAQLTQALAKGARNQGAKIIRFCPVSGVRRENGDWIVETPQGEITCEKVVNAAGYRAHEVGAMFAPFSAFPDRYLPCVSLAHQYLVTEPIDELVARSEKLPLLRDPDSSYYLRQEKDALLLGPYERNCRAHWLDTDDPMPRDFSFQLFADDLDRLEWYIEDACARVPILGSVGLTRVVNGPIPYTPDGNPLIGPMPGVENAYEACVFTFGIVQAGGAGKIAAEWIVQGAPEWDMWSCDPRRFTSFVDPAYAKDKAIEIYSHEYAMHFPHYNWPAARDKRLSPVHEQLKALGAQFMASAGWERAAWYAAPDDETALDAQTGWQREGPWYAAVRRECLAVRDAAGICDLPGFSRYRLSGEGAAQWLDSLITGVVPAVGRIGLVYFADKAGRVLTEMTVLRIAQDVMFLLGAAGAEWHDLETLRDHLPRKARSDITLDLVTEDFTCFILAGPRTRDILSPITDADLSNEANPWLTHQSARIGEAWVQLVRVSYVGELGWEVHVKRKDATAVWDALIQAGAEKGLKPFGLYAMDSLRLEKAYRTWKQDLSTDYTMLSAGLERFIKWDKVDFIGKAALQAQKQRGSEEAFAVLSVDAIDCDAPYLASVWQGDTRIGLVTSGGYGHRVDKSIALCVIAAHAAVPGTPLHVDIYGKRCAAVVEAGAHYDRDNSRLKA